MTIKATHDLHDKRKSRNIGVAIVLVVLVALIVMLTFVKLLRIEEERRMKNMIETNNILELSTSETAVQEGG